MVVKVIEAFISLLTISMQKMVISLFRFNLMTRTNDVQPERSREFQYVLVSITRRIQSVLKAKCTDLFTLTLHGGRVNKSRSLVQTSILFLYLL